MHLSAEQEAALAPWVYETVQRYSEDPETLRDFIVSTIKGAEVDDINAFLKLELADFIDDETPKFVDDLCRLFLTKRSVEEKKSKTVISFDASSSDEERGAGAASGGNDGFRPQPPSTQNQESTQPASSNPFQTATPANPFVSNNNASSGGQAPKRWVDDVPDRSSRHHESNKRSRNRWEEEDGGEGGNGRNVRPRNDRGDRKRQHQDRDIIKDVRGVVTVAKRNFALVNDDIYITQQVGERSRSWPLRVDEHVSVNITRKPVKKGRHNAVYVEVVQGPSNDRNGPGGRDQAEGGNAAFGRQHPAFNVARRGRGGHGRGRGGRGRGQGFSSGSFRGGRGNFGQHRADAQRSGNRSLVAGQQDGTPEGGVEGPAAGENGTAKGEDGQGGEGDEEAADAHKARQRPKKTFAVTDTAKLLEERKKQRRALLQKQREIYSQKTAMLKKQMTQYRAMLKTVQAKENGGGAMEITLMTKITKLASDVKDAEAKIGEAEKGLN